MKAVAMSPMQNLFGTLSGVFTGLLIVLFIGIVAWAWSSARRGAFEASARLPLEEDIDTQPHSNRERAP
jgi:cytochrome c oxidase cbb3-type subunit 4